MATHTYPELSKKLLQVESAITTLRKTQYSKSEQGTVQEQIKRLKVLKESLTNRLSILKETTVPATISYKGNLPDKVLKVDPADVETVKNIQTDPNIDHASLGNKKLKEEAGRKYTAEEAGAIGKTVGKSLLKVLRAQGDEVVDIRLTGIGLNKFNIRVKYGNNKGQDLFKFTLNPEIESIVLDLGSEPMELVDFVITQGNTVSLPTPELEDKLSDAMKKYVGEPSPEEYDQMAAQQFPDDESQITRNIAEDANNFQGLSIGSKYPKTAPIKELGFSLVEDEDVKKGDIVWNEYTGKLYRIDHELSSDQLKKTPLWKVVKKLGEDQNIAEAGAKGFGEYFSIPGLGEFRTVDIRDGIVNAIDSSQNRKSFRLEKVQQENPNYGKKAPREKKPREEKPQGVRPYTESQYRKILQGAIDDAGSTEFAYDIADSMILDVQILARLAKDYPGASARELKQRLQWDLEACDSPEDDYDDDYEGEVAEQVNEDDYLQPDDESSMAKAQLKSIQSNASKLMNIIGDDEQLDAWVQAKLTKAEDYLDSAAGYLESEEGEEQAPVTAVVALNEKKATYCGRCGHTHVKGTPCPRPFKEGVVAEKLGPNSKPETYIKDFKKSDAPQFKGKSAEKKRQMAIAAYMSNKNEALDVVGKEDDDINNDGKVDKTDKYLKNRRNVVSKKITKEEVQQLMLEAYVEVLQEEEETVLKTSTQEILGKFPTVKKAVVSLLTQEFPEFVQDIKWVAPKPSTFQVVLKNGQPFYLKWTGKGFDAQIEGKSYFLGSTSDYQQALDKLNDILKNGPISQGEEPGGEEFGSEPAPGGGGGGDFPGGEAGGGEETPAPEGGEEGGEAAGAEFEEETPEAL